MTGTKQIVDIYTDGACSGNPGPGGWGAVLIMGEHRREISGGTGATTNNRMEMTAAIEALSVLKRPCTVRIHTDSQYLKNGVTQWLAGWKRKGWTGSDKKPIKNRDLWEKIDSLISSHTVEFHWVKGHAGHPLNERADFLATSAIPR